jgi:Carboxypeptidase regulatory-like domain
MWTLKLTLTSISFSLAGAVFATDINPDAEGKINTESVYGKVIHEDSNKPLRDVIVTAILLNKKEKFTITDNDGLFGINELKPGTYKLIFEKDGYKKVIKDKVNIKANASLELNVEMDYQGFDLSPSPFHFMESTKSRTDNSRQATGIAYE